MAGIELGKTSVYSDRYDAGFLEAIPRSVSRVEDCARRYYGFDMWHGYELSWLTPTGVPSVAILQCQVPASSDNIIESKSFKYYLNSFNQTAFDSAEAVQATISRDLSAVAAADVAVEIFPLHGDKPKITSIPGVCIDTQNIDISDYQPDSALLACDESAQAVVDQRLFSHLLKSNCPVTGQPDWATLWLQYSGKAICQASLLKYIVSFRQYQGFHESCVERIFSDISQVCEPQSLCVYARYTRRGGLDINPFRVSENLQDLALPFVRTLRQ